MVNMFVHGCVLHKLIRALKYIYTGVYRIMKQF